MKRVLKEILVTIFTIMLLVCSVFAVPSAVEICDGAEYDGVLADETSEYVASITTTSQQTYYYTDIQSAFAKVVSYKGAVLKLLDDVELDEKIVVRSGNFTIDLNGKKITSTLGYATSIAINFSGSSKMYVSIIDSSDVKGEIISNAIGLYAYNTQLTLGEVKISAKNVGVTTSDNSLLTINGADITCTGSESGSAYNCAINVSSSNCVINSGTFTGPIALGMYQSRVPDSSVVINGGEFLGSECDIVMDHDGVDMRKHSSPDGITVYHEECPTYPYDPEYDKYRIKVPEGYGWFDSDGNAFDILEYFETYTLKKLSSNIDINIGAKADSTNERYVEIGGVQTKISDDSDVYTIEAGDKDLLVEFIEKTSSANPEVVKTQYFYVDMSKRSATKLSMDSYMSADKETSVRVNDPMGVRFKSQILMAPKLETAEFVIDEYGFIVATEERLSGKELNFGFDKYVTGVAYNKARNRDVVFDSDDTKHVFTCVVKNVPVKNYKSNLVCKTYTKITVNGKQFVVYGEPVVGNIYDTAKKLVETDTTLDEETYNALIGIILSYENEVGLPGDELYP